MHDLIPVTVIEHAGPFPPSMEGVYLTYQGQTVWIPYAGWTPKEQE